MAIAARKDVVGVWHVDKGAAFNAVGIAHVEANVVFYIELPKAFVILEGEAEEVAVCESILVMGVHAECWGDYPCWCVFEYGMGEGVMEAGPV